ncbi:MAG: hypothetical protein ACP5N2_00620 [Candidatus Nanoarchaeia archaeon]
MTSEQKRKIRMEQYDFTSIEDEQQLEEIRGENSKKPKMNILNQKRLSKWEMDELFLDNEHEEYDEEM